MSDTPRTDDAYYPTGLIAGDGFGNCKKTLRSVIYESRKLERELAAARAENVTRKELMLATYEAGQTELAAVYAQLREVVVLLSNHREAFQIPITVFKRIKAKLEESR